MLVRNFFRNFKSTSQNIRRFSDYTSVPIGHLKVGSIFKLPPVVLNARHDENYKIFQHNTHITSSKNKQDYDLSIKNYNIYKAVTTDSLPNSYKLLENDSI